VKDRYIIYVCEICGDHNLFAGFCDKCLCRLKMVPVVPVALLSEQPNGRDQSSPLSSSVTH
jgi:hypothetical protein